MSGEIESMTVEEFVLEAKRLRANVDVSEREFMMFLRAGEALPALWHPHAVTFDRFLKGRDICEPSRYRNSCRALDVLPLDVIKTIGIRAAVCAEMAPDKEKRDQIVAEMVATAERNGVALSEQTARRIVNRYVPSRSRALTERTRVADLERKAREYEKRIAELEAEVISLRARLGETEARTVRLV